MDISYIWLDLGYTLLYQNREEAYERYAAAKGKKVGRKQIERAYHLADKLFMREYPHVLGRSRNSYLPWYIAIVNHYLELEFDLYAQCAWLEEARGAQAGFWQPFEGVHQTLEELRDDGYGIGLISNWDVTARDLLQKHGLMQYMNHVVISSEVGCEKPDKEIFSTALALADVQPEACLYVGDNYYDDVVGSEKVGMDAFLINRFGQEGIEEISHPNILSSVNELTVILRKKKERYSNYV